VNKKIIYISFSFFFVSTSPPFARVEGERDDIIVENNEGVWQRNWRKKSLIRRRIHQYVLKEK
jgi:hypothetical protein